MTELNELSDNVYIAIWNDIANGGKPFWILLSLLTLFFLKEQIIHLIGFFIGLISKKLTHKVKSYKSSDLKKTPII